MELLIVFLFSLTPLLWLANGQIILGHDSGFRLNALSHLTNLLSSWYPFTNFGIDWSLYHGFLPIQLLETIATTLLPSYSLGQLVTFVGWFFAIGASLYVFLRYFFPSELYAPLRLLGPVLYMYNFYLLDAWAIVERAKFSLYIALPLLIVIVFKTMRHEWSLVRGAILFGLLFFFFNGGGSLPLYGGILVAFGLLFIFFLISSVRLHALRLVQMCVAFALCFFLFGAYWIVPQVRLMTQSYSGAVASRGGIEGLIAWEKEISKHASIANILRLQGFPNWYNNPHHPYAHPYLTHPLLIIGSFIPLTIAIMGVFALYRHGTKKEKHIFFFLLILGAIGIWFTAGSHPPLGNLYTLLMRHVPGFAIFRSSLYKFAPTVYLPIIVFFSYAIAYGLSKVSSKKNVRSIGALIIASIWVVYHFPFFQGNFFTIDEQFTTKVTVPSYVTDVQRYVLTHTAKEDRILVVPPLDSGFINSPIDTYTWGFYSLDILPRSLASRSFVANDSSDDALTKLLYQSIREQHVTMFEQLARTSGITHVLFRGDAAQTQTTDAYMTVPLWKEKLDNIDVLTPVYDSGQWHVYQKTTPSRPIVFAATDVTVVNTTAVNDAELVMSTPDDSVVVRTDDPDYTETGAQRSFVEAECFLCKIDEYNKVVEAITVPSVRSSRFAFLNRWRAQRDMQLLASSLGTAQEVDIRLSFALKALRIGHVDDFKHHLEESVLRVSQMTGRQKDYYANRVMAYLDAAFRDTTDTSVRQSIETYRQRMRPMVWKAEPGVYRLGFTLPKGGVYSFWSKTPNAYSSRMMIDDRSYPLTTPVSLGAGYHRLTVYPIDERDTYDAIASAVFLRVDHSAVPQEVPQISVDAVSATRFDVHVANAVSPFVLVLNQRYDFGWTVLIDGKKQHYDHLQANGFANAWRIPAVGAKTLTLVYVPQEATMVGRSITIAWIIILSIGVCIHVRRRTI
jgi:hypothetical protein